MSISAHSHVPDDAARSSVCVFPPTKYGESSKESLELKSLSRWIVNRIVHFRPNDLIINGLSHFGFHDRTGKHYGIFHQKHFLGLIGKKGKLEWTLAASQIFKEVPNIQANLNYPMYIDNLDDGSLVVSNFGDAQLYRVDVDRKKAEVLVNGLNVGMKDAGNCVVDDENTVWVNEVTGCKIWRFDSAGKPRLTIGNGTRGFQNGNVGFKEARFNWIYDIRRGPDDNIYVLDSGNFAVRMIDLKLCLVQTLSGTGKPGYEGDGEDASKATFGSNPSARFDGPISLSLDEKGNIFVGDRQNHVVRMIQKNTNIIETIAGNHEAITGKKNRPAEADPFKLNLPEISSMDYHCGYLFVPTDIAPEEGDLALLARTRL